MPPLLVTVSTSPGAPCHFYKQFNLHINGFMEVKRGGCTPTHSERAYCCWSGRSNARWKSQHLIMCRTRASCPKYKIESRKNQQDPLSPLMADHCSLLILSGPQFTIQCLVHAAALSFLISANITIIFVQQKWRSKSIGGV